jgi:ankyrin repeat protein
LLLEYLYSIGVNIHQASSRSYPSLLHATIEGIKPVQAIRFLIKHGADCNIKYTDDQTPLFHAVAEGPLGVVRVLVEEGGASMDVRDNCGRTAIDLAKYYASDPKNRVER